jgi:hypothetical protein
MAPNGDKIRVTARISKELDTKVHQYYTNLAPAITEGLERLIAFKEDNLPPKDTNKGTDGTGDLMARIGDMEKQIEFLKRQIEIKDSQLEKQAYSLQSLIQVNSALNLKLLPENTLTQKEEPEPDVKEKEPMLQRSQSVMQAEPEITTLDYVIREEQTTIEPEKEEKQKRTVEKVCLNCNESFKAQRSRAQFCSKKCKTAYYRKQEAEKK